MNSRSRLNQTVFSGSLFVSLAFLLAGCGNAPTPDQAQRRSMVFVEVERARQEAIVSTVSPASGRERVGGGEAAKGRNSPEESGC